MKLSTNFVKDYVDIDVDVKTLAEDMTKVGNEYDSCGKMINASKLVVGEIKECKMHPDSDHLHLCKVDVGTEVLNIVCGAPNAREGLKVIVALDGAELPGGTIKKGKIRGEESNGMLCSMAELGLEHKFLEEADKTGIHELPLDAPVGVDAIKYMQMDDEVIDFELTANRGDLLSILGMAYEIAAIYDKKVKDIDLSYNENNEEVGTVGKDVELSLNKENISEDTKYFKVITFDDSYYIKYQDVDKIDKLSEVSDRYKNYIVFNENIVTNDKTLFYDDNDKLIYSFNKSYSLPIIIKDTDKYGVEFNNRLLYVKKNDVKEINKNNNTDKKNSSGIAVLNYHAFYDENNAEEKANCTTEICHSKKQFKSQLNLIKEKDMLTLQMKEVEMYIDGKVQLPKSVLITIDDGPKTKIAVDLLTEYKMYATIFLVTSWFDEKEYYKTDYIELHSHTHNMHDGGKCHGGQGGAIKCLPEEEIQKDLKQSREELNGSTVFCYPFYEYNDYSIKMLKQAGFTMAFIGESNNSDNLIHVGSDKFRLRRFVIVTYTTISDLNKYFDQIK